MNSFALIRRILSPDRLESHRRSPDEQDDVLFARHQANMAICETFFGPLMILELVLRNSLDGAVAHWSGQHDWLVRPQPWMTDAERADVARAHAFLAGKSRHHSQAEVVHELGFGFWTSLLGDCHEDLFRAEGARAFAGMPAAVRTRANVCHRFDAIRHLRNRIFHYRRIWNRPTLARDFDDILEAINWVHPDACRLLLPAGARERFVAEMGRMP